jgi:hypothetical protein
MLADGAMHAARCPAYHLPLRALGPAQVIAPAAQPHGQQGLDTAGADDPCADMHQPFPYMFHLSRLRVTAWLLYGPTPVLPYLLLLLMMSLPCCWGHAVSMVPPCMGPCMASLSGWFRLSMLVTSCLHTTATTALVLAEAINKYQEVSLIASGASDVLAPLHAI